VFGTTVYNVNKAESTALFTSIGAIAATDADIGLAGMDTATCIKDARL